jgi:predicted nucleotidyltransferase
MAQSDEPRSLSQTIEGVLEQHSDVLEAYLYGSQARNEARPQSDVDIAVYVADETAFDQAGVAAELMSTLGRDAVDLVVLNRAPPLLYHRVLRDGARILSRDLRATTVREGEALSRYCDYVPQLAKIDRVLSARIARGDFGR